MARKPKTPEPPAEPMTWTQALTEQARAAYQAARGLIALVDDGALTWKPATGKNWMTTGQLLRHLAGACGGTSRWFVSGDWSGGEPDIDPAWKPAKGAPLMPPAEAYLSDTKAEALAALDRDEQLFGELLKKAGEERLLTERSAPPWGGPARNLGQHFLLGIQHLHGHKSQLFYYLKLQGKSVNTSHIWG